jgi:hypothetical protein
VIVSLTAWKRPHYLRETLDALEAAGSEIDELVYVVTRVEPNEREDEVLALLDRGPHWRTILNEKRLGLQRNNLAAISDAWELAALTGEDYVLGLSEDIVLAPDALRLAVWMRERYRTDRQVQFTGLFSGAEPERFKAGGDAEPPAGYLRVTKSEWFYCQGWGTWRDRWEEDWLPNWNRVGRDDSWDSNVNPFVMQGRVQTLPLLSRCKHIGLLDGTHSTPENFVNDNPTRFAGDEVIPDGPFCD